MKGLLLVGGIIAGWCLLSITAALFWGAVCALNDGGDGLGEGEL